MAVSDVDFLEGTLVLVLKTINNIGILVFNKNLFSIEVQLKFEGG